MTEWSGLFVVWLGRKSKRVREVSEEGKREKTLILCQKCEKNNINFDNNYDYDMS